MKLMVSVAMAAGALLSLAVPAFAGEGKACDKNCPKAHAHLKSNPIAATPRAEAPSLGARDAAVTVEVWSDFQCPFCAKGASIVGELREKYGDKVRIVFRHQPLPMHGNARLAAIATMAAHEQGKFWQMHDVLFDNQRSLDRASLEEYARGLGLDLPRFRAALDNPALANYVDAEVVEAQRRGIAGTPTFFVNGKSIMGARPLEDFTQLIDAELKR
ncbi:DsbA family protein [Pyxidicoccus fallax]|uniref:DsbA family protein n=1 Tax=Pyxidicoccus fallax TaxID=394095 RepID=A0A848M044_9BACT|nr:thioredoxin domain-containing protein [Pyxidicoccus fallax]NMO23142.1 DsbA family protein [Pyxidicoccus fallax]NPC85821.1 DsbA family protein [Pyxidicoccus fallax]